ncbi:MAG: amino acid adenylation domain-containing protein [Gemmatimonadota bacterium]
MQTPPGTPVRGALSESKRALLEKRMRGEAAGRPSSSAITRRADDGPAPLSFAQEHLWFMEQMEPGHPRYHLPGAIRLIGPVDPAALERALTEAVARHESLRTVFPLVDGKPVQVVLPELRVPVPVVDVPEVPGEDREATVDRMVREEGARPFDLERGPLIRAVLFRLSEREHVLLQVVHHIASDGWSQGLFSREFSALYEHYALGAPRPELPEPAVRYRDFAVWQREYLAGSGAFRRDLEYWKQRLAGAPQLELPTDRPRPAVQSGRGAMYRFPFGEPLADAARSLALESGVTLHMLLVAVFSATLHHYTGQEDQLVGSLLGGRGRPETERVVGYFVNLTALRVDLSGDPTFRQLLRRVRDAVLDSDAHQDLPFARIVHEVGAAGDLSRHPLIQAMVFAHNFVRHTVPFPGEAEDVLQAVPMYADSPVALVDTGTAKFDLSLALHDIPGSLTGLVEYSTDLFERDTVVRLVRHYLRVLEQVAAAPDTRLGELRLADAEERRRAVEEWNDTRRPFPREATLHALFAGQAARAPGAAAVRWDGGGLTYGELDALAEGLARRLAARGVRPEQRVGVLLPLSAEMVAAWLAVLRAGAAYVPLDPAYPRERLGFLARDAGVSVALTSAALRGLLPAGVRAVCVDEPAGAEADGAPLPDALPADALAQVIYTSGSTGTPKGVAVPHRAVVRLLRGADFLQVAADDRVAPTASPVFDAATWEVWAPLVNGACLEILPREAVPDPRALAGALRERGVSVLFLTTALLHQAAREEPGAFAGLRALLFGGEAADPGLVRRVLEHGAPGRLLHLYGPTESTVYASWHPVAAVAPGAATVPIGRPVSNTTLYVLGPAMEVVPPGVPGELYAGGDGVARGYLGRPELTAEKFVPDPFSGEPGARLYRTGDRARWSEAGELEFLGRMDRQVKVRGFRIEPGEVEAALRALPGLRDAVVAAREGGPGAPGERRLVAYVVPGGDAPPVEELREALRERLPEYMVPTAFVVLDALPLTATGKTDRRALPAPEDAAAAREHVAPRTPTEIALAEIWAEVLGRDRVGAEDSFFELGGHSLLATQVNSRVRERLGADLPVRAVFEEVTVERLARRIDERRDAAPAAASPITRRSREAYRVSGGPA